MFLCILGNIRQNRSQTKYIWRIQYSLNSESSSNQSLDDPSQGNKAKGAKVDHCKPTRPKMGRAKLARAYKKLILEIKVEQDRPECRSTRLSDVGSGRVKVLFTSNSFRMSTKAFSMGRAEPFLVTALFLNILTCVPDARSTRSSGLRSGRMRWAASAFAIFLNIVRGPITFVASNCCCQDFRPPFPIH